MQIIENGVGNRGSSTNNQNGYLNSNQNQYNELYQVIQVLQNLEKYRSVYEDQIIARYQNQQIKKGNQTANSNIKALGFKIFSKIHKLNGAYLNKIQIFFPKLYEIIFQDQLAQNNSLKENASQLTVTSDLTLGKIFALIAKGGRQRLQKEITKLQSYTTQYPNLSQERNKSNKNERFYQDKYFQGVDSFKYITSLQKKFFLKQQPIYKISQTLKKGKGGQNYSHAYSGNAHKMYDDIMYLDQKKGNEGNTSGPVNSSQTLHFQKEQQSIFEIILSNYEKYIKESLQSNRQIGNIIRNYSQNVQKFQQNNKQHLLFKDQNQKKEEQIQIKNQQQIGSMMNLNNNQPKQFHQQRMIGSTNNLDRLLPSSVFDSNSKYNNIQKLSPSKNMSHSFSSIPQNPFFLQSFQQKVSNQQKNIQKNFQDNYYQQSQQPLIINNHLHSQNDTRQQETIAPILLSNKININNNSKETNPDLSEDFSSSEDQNEIILSNNGLPSYNDIDINNSDNKYKKQYMYTDQLLQNRKQFDSKITQKRVSKQNIKENEQYQENDLSIDMQPSIDYQQKGYNQSEFSNKSNKQNTEKQVESQNVKGNKNKSMNNIQPSLKKVNINPFQNDQIIKQAIPSQISIGAIIQDDSYNLLNTQNTLEDIPEQMIQGQKTQNDIDTIKLQNQFKSLNNIDMLSPQKEHFQKGTSSTQQNLSNFMIPRLKPKQPLAKNIILKKYQQLNQNKDLEFQNKQFFEQNQQQVGKQLQNQQQQQNSSNNISLNENIGNNVESNTNITVNANLSTIPVNLNKQKKLYTQQNQPTKNEQDLFGQNIPMLFDNSISGTSDQVFNLNKNNSLSPTKMSHGVQQHRIYNISKSQSVQQNSTQNLQGQNNTLYQQQIKSQMQQYFQTQEQQKEKQNAQQQHKQTLNLQLQQSHSQHQQQENRQAPQEQIQQEQLSQQQKQYVQQNGDSLFGSPSSQTTLEVDFHTQKLQSKKINPQSQFMVQPNKQQKITQSQILLSQTQGIAFLQKQPSSSLSQTRAIFSAQSLSQIPSNNNPFATLTTLQQGQVNGTNNQLQSTKFQQQNTINLTNSISQKNISDDISIKQFRNSLNNDPKNINTNFLSGYSHKLLAGVTNKNINQNKKQFFNSTNSNNIKNQQNGIEQGGQITKIIEENKECNIPEKRNISSASSLYSNYEGTKQANNKLNTSRTLKMNSGEKDELLNQDNCLVNDMFSKTQNQIKSFIISPPRKTIGSKGSKRPSNADQQESQPQQKNPLLLKTPNLINFYSSPAISPSNQS